MTYNNPPDDRLKDKLILLGRLLQEKKASQVLALDVGIYSSAFEGIILASAQGKRHSRALADHLLDHIKKNNLEYLGMEGFQEGEWILLDLNEVIVHIFVHEARLFYNLEGFWTKGKIIELNPGEKNV